MRHGLALVAAIASLGAPACRVASFAGTSPAYLIVTRLDARPGAAATTDGSFGSTLQSDVVTDGRAVEDVGRVSFALALKDPGTPELPSRPSTTNVITVNRYRVRFVRADGRSAPGIDVPYPFEGAMTLSVGADEATGTFPLVRLQAKLESPLANLRNGGGEIVLSTLADVTFHGRDQAGHLVSVSGLISVNFADWRDPE